MTEETSSVVTEMITSIENVAKITQSRKAATDHLVQTTQKSGEKLNHTVTLK